MLYVVKMYLDFYYKTSILSFVAQKKQLKPFLWKQNVLKNTTLNLTLVLKKTKHDFLEQQTYNNVKTLIFVNFFFYDINFFYRKLSFNKKMRLFVNKYHKRKIRYDITPEKRFMSQRFSFFETLCIVNEAYNPSKIMQIKKMLSLHNKFIGFPWIFKFNIQKLKFGTKTLTKNNMVYLRLFFYNFVRNTVLFLKYLNFFKTHKQFVR